MKMKDDLVIKEIRKTRKTFCKEFKFDVKKNCKGIERKRAGAS